MEAVKKYLPWVLIVWIAIVFLPSDFFKLSGDDVSVRLFTKIAEESGIGLFEPTGRYLVALAEIAAIVLLVMPSRRMLGALLTLVLMIGAVLTHLLFIGVTVVDAQGEIVDASLFGMAVSVVIASLILIWLERQDDSGEGDAAPVGD